MAGAQAITATDASNANIIGTEENILVQPAAASASKSLVSRRLTPPVQPRPSPSPLMTPTATWRREYTGTVHFTSSDGQASLPANATITPEELGTDTFTVTLKTAGTQSITATDTTTSSITGSETGIVVQAAAMSGFSVTGFPSPDTAGTAENFTVTAVDPYGNVITGYLGKIQFLSNDPHAVLPASYTFLSTDDGKHTFSATLKTAGTNRSLKATDTTNSSFTGTSSVVVQAASAQSLAISGLPATVTPGVATSFTATAYDLYGNVATGYTGTVQFTQHRPRRSPPGQLYVHFGLCRHPHFQRNTEHPRQPDDLCRRHGDGKHKGKRQYNRETTGNRHVHEV